MWAWEAFTILNRMRGVGYSGPQPISVTDLWSYIQMKRIDDEDQVELLLAVIPELDSLFIADFHKNKEKPGKKR